MVDDRIILRGFGPEGGGGSPTILQRTDQEFIEAVLDELSAGDGLRAVGRSIVSGGLRKAEADVAEQYGLARSVEKISGGREVARRVSRKGSAAPILQLFQPVHRTFHLALLEAVCDSLMTPRLDPERIESAGIVVRRVGIAGAVEQPAKETGRLSAVLSRRRREQAAPSDKSLEMSRRTAANEVREGWMQSGKRVRGWVPFSDEELSKSKAVLYADPTADPDPARRPAPLRSGHAEVDQRLAQWLGQAKPLHESVTPLFVAPPEVCKAAGRTILYGLIPVTSVETSEPEASGASGEAFTQELPFDLQGLRGMLPDHLPYYLQRQGRMGANSSVPLAERRLTFYDADDAALERFILTLRQLRYEFDAFGEGTSEGDAVFAELNRITLSAESEMPLGEFLKRAADILVELDGREQAAKGEAVPSLTMPRSWPSVSAAQETRFVNLIFEVLKKRLESLAAGEGRFDDPRGRYRLRAFVRVKRRDGCPPVVWWSEYSEPFTIAPWYESGDARPVQIQLPDAAEAGFLDKVKPNVAFVVPESLQNLLNRNKPDSFLKGEAEAPGGGIGLDWICGFNIPIITLCAFIVLNIFLQLLNIVFWWLFFIKICIPFPRRK